MLGREEIPVSIFFVSENRLYVSSTKLAPPCPWLLLSAATKMN